MQTETGALVATPAARPRFIGPDERYLFAWHHPARPEVRRDAAVLLCPPLGFDYICVYRTWRILAEQLASLGFDAIRFDYDGTGDSAGDLEEPGRPEAWLRSIERVIGEAQELTASGAVALLGLRLGATLALQAATARGGVDRLVLWSPFRSSRAYLRELKAFADALSGALGRQKLAAHEVQRGLFLMGARSDVQDARAISDDNVFHVALLGPESDQNLRASAAPPKLRDLAATLAERMDLIGRDERDAVPHEIGATSGC